MSSGRADIGKFDSKKMHHINETHLFKLSSFMGAIIFFGSRDSNLFGHIAIATNRNVLS